MYEHNKMVEKQLGQNSFYNSYSYGQNLLKQRRLHILRNDVNK